MGLFEGAVSLPEVGSTWMPKSQPAGILFTPMEITIGAAKSGACYLPSLAPETFGAWCGSLKVKKLSTKVFASDNTGLISGGFSWPLQVQSILYEMFRYRICKKIKNSQTRKKDFPPKLPWNNVSWNWCVTVPVSCSCISKSYVHSQQ